MVNIENASYSYDEAGKQGIYDLSLRFRKGECVLLCGESGCGKTTVTRLLNGLIPHFYEGEFTGKVTIAGKNTAEGKPDSLASSVGSVFQNPRSQFFNLDTTSEIAFGCENMGLQQDEIRRRVMYTAEMLGITRLLDRDIFELSGGEKQLVAMASVYALEPELFVLDEPSSNLDAEATEELAGLLRKLKRMGKTIIIAEHRLYYLTDLIDRVIYIQNGVVAADWTGEEFFTLSDKERMRLGLRAFSLNELRPQAIPAPTYKEEVLKVEGVSASYNPRKPVLRDITLRASPGEVIGVIGRNGQGKSTLARVLCGLHKHSSGYVAVDGKTLTAAKRSEQFYLVMQDSSYQLFTDSVESELKLSKRRKEQPEDEKVYRIMEDLSLTACKDRHPMSLSGGQKQRCAIGVSLVRNARVIIFDEPTSGLDYRNMIQVCNVIRDLQRKGKVIFIITHDYELLLAACNRVIELADGKVAKDVRLGNETVETIKSFFM